MERTKVINISPNSLGFEIGGAARWRGEFSLEQVSEFDIKPGKELTVHLLEIEDVFASVEFSETEKTTVPVTKVPENNELFSPGISAEADTLQGEG